MNRLLRLLLVACLALAAGACRRKPAAPSAVTQPPAPPNPQVDLPRLIDAARAHGMTQGRLPETLDDLVKAGLIDRLPTAPPGKKYVLDAKKTGVILVNQ